MWKIAKQNQKIDEKMENEENITRQFINNNCVVSRENFWLRV